MLVSVINPNSSEIVTQAIDSSLSAMRIRGLPDIGVQRLEGGPPSISTQADADEVIAPLIQFVKKSVADAFVIACFSDPGIHAVREAAGGRPVLGIGECGISHALTLGDHFGIIALSNSSVQRQKRYVRQMGLIDRYSGSYPVQASAGDTAKSDFVPKLITAGRELTSQHGADVVILGCAGMSKHRLAVEDALGCHVIEPVQQAVWSAVGRLISL